ncbi:MAG: hypothetical protein J7J05_02270 [Thermococcus sp.]|uniref:hypothetical protein n=1 Tax=Thermococcus sp. TaxID=35749 RepID=UPI0026153C94|nr:hypothetical protein [Thermococcus sp.]MCD6139763.1 hypothetical protein [Thermococcus sp.]MCD6143487.1 hypothetical protein [Thermococcus sp.]
MIVIVLDTNVLRRALEEEKGLKGDEETKLAYEIVTELIKCGNIIFVINADTASEYYRHLEALKKRLKQSRIAPQSFKLLSSILRKMRKVPTENHEFEIEGEAIGRKDCHLLNSAKTGALKSKVENAFVLTFAQDVYRSKKAKNGCGITIYLINLKDEKERKLLEQRIT